jgi:ectoine hydroxylase-related dioxygenase (phytanoyl-CoA dioxygenase family)
MTAALVTDEAIEAFHRDGVVCLRHAFSPKWINALRAGFERNLTDPSHRASMFYDDGAAFVGLRDSETRGQYTGRHDLAAKPRFAADIDTWRTHPEFDQFIHYSPVAEMAGRIMRATKANLFLQEIMLKDAGTDTPTPWHSDMPFFPMEGGQTCTVWIPLDPIRRENGIEYVRGSHRWGKAFLPLDMPDPRQHYGVDVSPFAPLPDIESHRNDYDIITWDMEPGDCIVHHGYAVHGAPGNSSKQPRRVFIVRWLGDDVRYHSTKHQRLAPSFPDCGLAEGAPMDCETFPVIWRNA